MRYNSTMKNSQPTSMRLTKEAKLLIREIAKKLGINQTAVVELAVRRLAEIENVNS